MIAWPDADVFFFSAVSTADEVTVRFVAAGSERGAVVGRKFVQQSLLTKDLQRR
ncbi:hypothetical protein [uncultured Jatrophihabitans sp.]|uniref:hypothetical protein n=1 Tax=uncultured Jatrophihabitans sp. TaxID=1610747 RepID=UPI0035CA81AF